MDIKILKPKTVAGIMGDFSAKIKALKELQTKQNREITKRAAEIKALKAENFDAQKEVADAARAIKALESVWTS